jgi:hypothetical protein
MENDMKTALKALTYALGSLFVIGFLAMGTVLIAYVALSLADVVQTLP